MGWLGKRSETERRSLFVGAEMEREYAELAERRIGAAERGSRWEIQTIGGGDPQDDWRGIGVKQY